MIIMDYSANDDQNIYRREPLEIGQQARQKIRIEAATIAGRRQPDDPQKPNEDTFAVVNSDISLFASVFDGCSSQKPIAALGDESGARFASHFLQQYVQTHSTQHVGELLREANRALLEKSLTLGANLADVHTLPATTATMITIDPESNTVSLAHVGDTFCLVLLKDGQTELKTIDRNKPYDEDIFSQIREIARDKGISPREAKQDPSIRQAVINIYQDSYNRPDGSGQGILNGDPNMEKYIQVTKLKLSDIRAILLGSDGLIPPGWDETRGQDQVQLFKIAEDEGARGLIAAKLKHESEDLDWKHTRFKHSDDGTVIYIRL